MFGFGVAVKGFSVVLKWIVVKSLLFIVKCSVVDVAAIGLFLLLLLMLLLFWLMLLLLNRWF